MTRIQRDTLERYAGGGLPLNRAIRAALGRIDELEKLAADLIDNHEENSGETTSLSRRARRLLERGTDGGRGTGG